MMSTLIITLMKRRYKMTSKQNEERVIKTLRVFGIERYHFATKMGKTIVIIQINLNTYWLEMFDMCDEIIVYKKKFQRRGTKKQKDYMEMVAKFKSDAIYSSINMIFEDSQLN